ncbi:MAG: hypothetical protein AAGA48_10255 [Myxococcota bacterium]
MIRTDMKFDVRTLKHRLRRGEVSVQELNAHLEELPDDAEELEETEVQFTASWAERHKDEDNEEAKG